MSGKGEYQSLVVFLGGRGGKETTSSSPGATTIGFVERLDLTFLGLLVNSGADAMDLMGILDLVSGGTSEAGVNSTDSESDDVTIVGISVCGSLQDHSLIKALALLGSKVSTLSGLIGGGLSALGLCGLGVALAVSC